MYEIEVLKKKVTPQISHYFRLFIPLGFLFNLLNSKLKEFKDFLSFIVNNKDLSNFIKNLNFDRFDIFDLNLYCKSVDRIPELSYEYKSFKFLNSNLTQMVGRNYSNDIKFTFLCDDEFKIYRNICNWCDIVELFSYMNLDLVTDISFNCLLTLYKIDSETPSKVFRFWGLRPKVKPSIGEFNRDNIDVAINLDVDFVFSYVERVI